jgi:hypothetical protein
MTPVTQTRDLIRRARLVTLAPGAVPSPCVSVCRMQSPMDGQDVLCEGCLRTLAEVAGWSGMDDGARRAVWQQIALRAAALTP